ncbi:MAG TPA: helix-turn-helix domain-containing protein [Cyclobacteriaceae bacterium]
MIKKERIKKICCIDYAFHRIGGKHKGRILWSVNEHGKLRYGELKRIITGITTKMLTKTLRELEQDNLLIRKSFQEIPPRVEYSLTEEAGHLIPFIEHLKHWGESKMIINGKDKVLYS